MILNIAGGFITSDDVVVNGRIETSPYTLASLEVGQVGFAGYRGYGTTAKKISLPSGGTYGYCFHHANSYYSSRDGDTVANADSQQNVAGGTEIIQYSKNNCYTSGIVIYWRLT